MRLGYNTDGVLEHREDLLMRKLVINNIDDLVLHDLGERAALHGRTFSDSADLLRQDRDR